VCASDDDDGMIGESVFTRRDDVDVALGDVVSVILGVAAVGDLEAASSLTGHEPGTLALLTEEQADDITLTECRAFADAKKGAYEWRD